MKTIPLILAVVSIGSVSRHYRSPKDAASQAPAARKVAKAAPASLTPPLPTPSPRTFNLTLPPKGPRTNATPNFNYGPHPLPWQDLQTATNLHGPWVTLASNLYYPNGLTTNWPVIQLPDPVRYFRMMGHSNFTGLHL